MRIWQTAVCIVIKDKVARSCRGTGNRGAVAGKTVYPQTRRASQAPAALFQNVRHKAGAVKCRRCGTAPQIRAAEILPRRRENPGNLTGRQWTAARRTTRRAARRTTRISLGSIVIGKPLVDGGLGRFLINPAFFLFAFHFLLALVQSGDYLCRLIRQHGQLPAVLLQSGLSVACLLAALLDCLLLRFDAFHVVFQAVDQSGVVLRNHGEDLCFVREVHDVLRIQNDLKIRGLAGQVKRVNALLKPGKIRVDLRLLAGDGFLLCEDIGVKPFDFRRFAVALLLQILDLRIQHVFVFLLLSLIVFQLLNLGVIRLAFLLQLGLPLLQIAQRSCLGRHGSSGDGKYHCQRKGRRRDPFHQAFTSQQCRLPLFSDIFRWKSRLRARRTGSLPAKTPP